DEEDDDDSKWLQVKVGDVVAEAKEEDKKRKRKTAECPWAKHELFVVKEVVQESVTLEPLFAGQGEARTAHRTTIRYPRVGVHRNDHELIGFSKDDCERIGVDKR
ncbi:hypothetical protein GUF49_14745, partial [Xanthomonas citri pv. citri]|nr:hypothetical protein [Xanthomonas citri pv. citri]